MVLAVVLHIDTVSGRPPQLARVGRCLYTWLLDQLDALEPSLREGAVAPVLAQWLAEHPLRGGPSLATQLHREREPGALTIAPLVYEGSVLEVRVCALGELATALLGELVARWQQAAPAVPMGAADGRVVAVAPPGAHPLARAATEAQLLAPPPGPRWRFCFHTPTTFKMGQVYQPLPVPVSLWRSWLRRWNRMLPAHAVDDAELGAFDEALQLTELELDLHWVQGHHAPIPGFLGTLTVEAIHRVPAARLALLTRLAHFATWAGTGVQTGLGMGVTEWRGAD